MDWPKVLTRCLLCNLLTGLGSPAAAMQTDETRACDNAAQTAALKYGVPPEIMLSIVRVESGRGEGKMPWPWTINSDGKSYWFETRQAAIEFADEKLATGSNNFDIGCFQINLRWHPDAFVSLEDALDPSANADYAAQFLTSLFQTEGDWKSAVAAYHSRSAALAKTYIAQIEAAYTNHILPSDKDVEPSTSKPVVPQNHFPLLQPGEASGFGSLVPRLNSGGALLAGGP
jgi:hypothetical protein